MKKLLFIANLLLTTLIPFAYSMQSPDPGFDFSDAIGDVLKEWNSSATAEIESLLTQLQLDSAELKDLVAKKEHLKTIGKSHCDYPRYKKEYKDLQAQLVKKQKQLIIDAKTYQDLKLLSPVAREKAVLLRLLSPYPYKHISEGHINKLSLSDFLALHTTVKKPIIEDKYTKILYAHSEVAGTEKTQFPLNMTKSTLGLIFKEIAAGSTNIEILALNAKKHKWLIRHIPTGLVINMPTTLPLGSPDSNYSDIIMAPVLCGTVYPVFFTEITASTTGDVVLVDATVLNAQDPVILPYYKDSYFFALPIDEIKRLIKTETPNPDGFRWVDGAYTIADIAAIYTKKIIADRKQEEKDIAAFKGAQQAILRELSVTDRPAALKAYTKFATELKKKEVAAKAAALKAIKDYPLENGIIVKIPTALLT